MIPIEILDHPVADKYQLQSATLNEAILEAENIHGVGTDVYRSFTRVNVVF